MIAVSTKYVRTSACECGFPVMNADVPLGKIYRVYPESIEHGKLRCGGCGKISPCDLILADDGVKPMGWLMLAILELDEGIAHV
jgi:hypothetical protein